MRLHSLAEASRRLLHEIERRKIHQALKDASGNAGIAAEILQIGYKNLLARIKEFGFDKEAAA